VCGGHDEPCGSDEQYTRDGTGVDR
jgi:hypothetical protein